MKQGLMENMIKRTHKKCNFFSVKYSLIENSSPDLVYPLNELTSLPICDLQMKVNSGSDRCGLLRLAEVAQHTRQTATTVQMWRYSRREKDVY